MKTRVFLTCGLLALALVSCKKELEIKQGAQDKAGTLAICINSTLTGQKLAGASVVVVGSPKDSTVSDANGVARLRLQAGTYELKISAEGYAPIYYSDPIEIKPLNGESDTPIFGETHAEVDMYALGATLTGRVVMLPATTEETARYVQGATVAIKEVDGVELVKPIEVKTDAEGLYTFDKAPVKASYDLEISYTQDGKYYETTVSVSPLQNGQTKQLASAVLSPAAAPSFRADIVVKPTTATAPLKITFPVAIATPIDTKEASISVSGATKLKFDYADGNRTLVITPMDADGTAEKWSVGGHYFSVSGLKGAKGESLNASGNFTIEAPQTNN